MIYQYDTLHCENNDGVLSVVIDNPPCNVMTVELYRDLVNFTSDVLDDDDTRVIVFDSADPDFFIAHFDVEILLQVNKDSPAERAPEPTGFHMMCDRVRSMPKATIARIGGRAGGGGNEFASCCDMRYGVSGKTVINQMEVALGILPGGTGTQSLPRLVGRNRAMEIILGSDDIDADTLADWGYLNRTFASRSAMDDFVDRLARRIADWPATAIALAKQSVNNFEMEWKEGLIEEAYLFQQTMRTAEAQRNMKIAMEMGAQTREGELRMGDLCLDVARKVRESSQDS